MKHIVFFSTLLMSLTSINSIGFSQGKVDFKPTLENSFGKVDASIDNKNSFPPPVKAKAFSEVEDTTSIMIINSAVVKPISELGRVDPSKIKTINIIVDTVSYEQPRKILLIETTEK